MESETSGYRKLATMGVIHLVVMFLLTFVLIARLEHFYVNINRIYMALLMVAPMMILMPLMMGSMFRNRSLNTAIYAGAVLVFAVVLYLGRTQTPVGDEQFLRSMIPHHSSAILMCEEAAITDPEIEALCVEIVQAQEEEIAQMEQILTRYR